MDTIPPTTTQEKVAALLDLSGRSATPSITAAVLATAGCLRPEPRVYRAGDPEPGGDLRAVLDAKSVLHYRGRGGGWLGTNGTMGSWRTPVWTWPIVEVHLPEPVTA